MESLESTYLSLKDQFHSFFNIKSLESVEPAHMVLDFYNKWQRVRGYWLLSAECVRCDLSRAALISIVPGAVSSCWCPLSSRQSSHPPPYFTTVHRGTSGSVTCAARHGRHLNTAPICTAFCSVHHNTQYLHKEASIFCIFAPVSMKLHSRLLQDYETTWFVCVRDKCIQSWESVHQLN